MIANPTGASCSLIAVFAVSVTLLVLLPTYALMSAYNGSLLRCLLFLTRSLSMSLLPVFSWQFFSWKGLWSIIDEKGKLAKSWGVRMRLADSEEASARAMQLFDIIPGEQEMMMQQAAQQGGH